MEKNPADRYATAKEMADDLKRFLNDEPTLARRPTLWQRGRKWARQRAAAVRATAAALLVMAIVLGTGTGWVVIDREARRTEEHRQQAVTEEAVAQDLQDAARLLEKGRLAEALRSLERADRPAGEKQSSPAPGPGR